MNMISKISVKPIRNRTTVIVNEKVIYNCIIKMTFDHGKKTNTVLVKWVENAYDLGGGYVWWFFSNKELKRLENVFDSNVTENETDKMHKNKD